MWGRGKCPIILMIQSQSFTGPVFLGCDLHKRVLAFFHPGGEKGRLEVAAIGYMSFSHVG